ncbi:MAG TPA: UDP-2,4-diacetamido-2,4,6-trideoxy-beta-L-altropyranose hydrolase [Rhodothermales bacterium]|nr:UDP-2,4-diacetamido-2,4,6-trideoxy-beta-L-altropyranose hydrolase [Rhodothermales bacterium]
MVRCDATVEAGTGHVMRCLALSQAWMDAGGQVAYVCAALPQALAARISEENIAVRRLECEAGSPQDMADTILHARAFRAKWLVVDGYHFGPAYQRALAETGLKVIVIDDGGGATHHCADFVVNQNLYADESLYPSRAPQTRLLLGCGFALLRREFWQWRERDRAVRSEARNVLVTLGGADAQNTSLSVLNALIRTRKTYLEVTVLTGIVNPHEDSIRRLAETSTIPIRVEHAVSDMPSQMAWADLAISAAGSTTWELLFMGLPSLVVAQAENQQPIARAVGLAGAGVTLDPEHTGDWSSTIARVLEDPVARGHLSQTGRRLVDGWGAHRVVQEVLNSGTR